MKLNIFKSILSILIISSIFLQVPKESLGLGGFQKNNSFLNLLIGIGVLIFFGIALKLNLDLDLYYSIFDENDLWSLKKYYESRAEYSLFQLKGYSIKYENIRRTKLYQNLKE